MEETPVTDVKPKPRKRGALSAGVILTGVGLIFLLSNLRLLPRIGRVWPLFLIVVGLALLAGSILDRK